MVGLYERDDEYARFSRFCSEARRCDDAGAIAYLGEVAVRSQGRPVLIPTSDRWVQFLAEHRSELEKRFAHYWVDPDLLATVADKELSAKMCASIGVPTPETRIPPTAGSIRDAARGFQFPCVIKLTNTVGEPLPGNAKVIVAETLDALATFYDEHPGFRSRTCWQELIEGGDDAMFEYTALARIREPDLVGVCTHKIRQYPPAYGLMSYGRSELAPQLADYAARIVRHVDWRGPASIEFKYRAKDGRFYFIETNPRLPWFNGLFRAAGVDLALLMYHDLAGLAEPPRSQRQRDGVYWVSVAQDIGSYWRRRGTDSWTFRSWFASLFKARAHAWFSVTDPLPTIRLLVALGGAVLRRAGRSS